MRWFTKLSYGQQFGKGRSRVWSGGKGNKRQWEGSVIMCFTYMYATIKSKQQHEKGLLTSLPCLTSRSLDFRRVSIILLLILWLKGVDVVQAEHMLSFGRPEVPGYTRQEVSTWPDHSKTYSTTSLLSFSGTYFVLVLTQELGTFCVTPPEEEFWKCILL